MKTLLMIPAIATTLVGGAYLMADDDHRYEKTYTKQAAANMPENPRQKSYNNECGSCHMAYQPEFLSKRTWLKMMNGLDDHFGVNATLAQEDIQILSAYLEENAADSKRVGKHFAKIAASADDTSMRITDTRYFKKEHREIAKKYIDQKEVKSIANCNACHQKAAVGDYRERNIFIPNYGRWDD